MIAASELHWEGGRLYLARKLLPFAVEPDAKYPGVMWRVRHQHGLSDMVNLSRARDAAVAMALRALNSIPREGIGADSVPLKRKEAA